MIDLNFYFLQAVREGSILATVDNGNIVELANRLIAYALIIAGFLSVVYIFIGGISFILSGGDEGKIKSAVSTIRYAIIGLVVTIAAVIIVNFVGRFVGLNTIQYLSFSEIVEVFQQISDDLRSQNGSDRVRTLD